MKLNLPTNIMLDKLNNYDIVKRIFDVVGFKPKAFFMLIR